MEMFHVKHYERGWSEMENKGDLIDVYEFVVNKMKYYKDEARSSELYGIQIGGECERYQKSQASQYRYAAYVLEDIARYIEGKTGWRKL